MEHGVVIPCEFCCKVFPLEEVAEHEAACCDNPGSVPEELDNFWPCCSEEEQCVKAIAVGDCNQAGVEATKHGCHADDGQLTEVNNLIDGLCSTLDSLQTEKEGAGTPAGGTASDRPCTICLTAPRNCVILSCAHVVTCLECGSNRKRHIMSNKYNLKWNTHHGETFASFETLRHREMFVDVTLSCNGQFLKAHKLVLCAGSGYFERILNKDGTGIPTIHFYGIEIHLLKFLVEFMYCGEVEVPEMDLEKFIEVAENLEVKGLKGDKSKSSGSHNAVGGTTIPVSDVHDALAHKRKSNVHSWQEFGESQFPPTKVPRSQAPVTQGRQHLVRPHSQQSKTALLPSTSEAHKSPSEPTRSASAEEVLIKDEEEEEDEVIDIPDVMNSTSAAAEQEELDHASLYAPEGVEGEPEAPLNIPSEVDPQTVTYVQSFIWCGKMKTTGTKLYFCPVCPYVTTRKCNAESHSRKHSKEKPFQCPVCFKFFTAMSSMKTHCGIQHPFHHEKLQMQ
ncbi:unnamed protein product [Darwinula stevensoni]|uniref:Uncharacterized protein n=1 Tax=Darwinula stevensoni TaxID=69355 RepID=A0A7R8X914_9CRUS|nr:unnamed protein product [Darwinula stevensoni]CAG0883919.1 unnamed protein product [Darwinula stevensoni]